MGRGRAKAKQTKVARELKYSSPQTDFERLQRELSGSTSDDRFGGGFNGTLEGTVDGDSASDDAWVEEDDWRR
ncbi:DUF3073 domain-containing protein [Mycobacterium sp. SMC-4]|uniref:DUF3073 domain-containing protein n=1 Tax=Mycobacterium sp. SMC-4 TaxID=2857059 RepID=UPI0021B2E434|nr:DUF3073 domain-containing protein [Mycobacterium sp. SMC-4]UXA17403.1 DUF3073 domain-containing protein [Mycobacterium sp. SMC-4]